MTGRHNGQSRTAVWARVQVRTAIGPFFQAGHAHSIVDVVRATAPSFAVASEMAARGAGGGLDHSEEWAVQVVPLR
jgi:hypothetical protein